MKMKVDGFFGTAMDSIDAVSAGINDYLIDEVNKLPFANFRKRPQYENELAKSIRGISGLILPFLGLKGSVKGVSGNIAARSPLATRTPKTNRALKWMLDLGIDTGIGAYVDSTAKTNQLDDNFAGFLKKEWKAVGKYIPSDWATLDGESPEVWAEKNRNEGVMMGFTSSFLEAGIKLARSIRGTRSVTDYVFENESAAAAFARAEETDPKRSWKTWRLLLLKQSRLWMKLVNWLYLRTLTQRRLQKAYTTFSTRMSLVYVQPMTWVL